MLRTAWVGMSGLEVESGIIIFIFEWEGVARNASRLRTGLSWD
jgi:hypothetical protein